MTEHRLDTAFATNRSPLEVPWCHLKRVGRYMKGRPRCVIGFPWLVTTITTSNVNRLDIAVFVDSGGADYNNDWRSTSGGMIYVRGHLLRKWSVTFPTPSL